MKIAIVHDWLYHKNGGAESVLFEIAGLYPSADIYALTYNKKRFQKDLQNRKVHTSKLQFFPGFMKQRPKLLFPFIKHAVKKMDFSEYDLVISSSSAWVKNISISNHTRHVCYCYSPARMLWDSWPKYIDGSHPKAPVRFYLINLASKLRLWDYYQSQNGTEFISISEHIQKRIKKFYNQPSKVIYPPVNIQKNNAEIAKKENYYIIISVLAKYKNIELAIKAFMVSGKKLVIAGDGPDKTRLEQIAKDSKNIVFLGRVTSHKKQELLSSARGFIFCNVEDFGITMVESIASGTPVIALRGGGAQEIIREGVTGQFYDQANEESINRCLVKFEKNFDINKKLENSYIHSKFSSETFKKELKRYINAK